MSTRSSSFLNCPLFQWNQWQQLAFFLEDFSDFSFTPAPANFTPYTTVSLSLKPLLMDRRSPVPLWAVFCYFWLLESGSRRKTTPDRPFHSPTGAGLMSIQCAVCTKPQLSTLHFFPKWNVKSTFQSTPQPLDTIEKKVYSAAVIFCIFWEWFLFMLKKFGVRVCV